MMLIDLWVLAVLIELVLVLAAALAFTLTRARRGVDGDALDDAADAALEGPHAQAGAAKTRAPARRTRRARGDGAHAAAHDEAPLAAGAPGVDVATTSPGDTHAPSLHADSAPTPPEDADDEAQAEREAAEREGVPIDTGDLDADVAAEAPSPEVVAMPAIAVELVVPGAEADADAPDDDAALEEPPAPSADEIAAVEAEAVEAARPTPVFLDAEDVAALSDGAGDGMTEDDLMMLQDLVSSTEAKVKREAKSMQNLLDRLTGEASALTGAAEEVNRTLEAEGIVEEVAVRLRKIAPALDSARGALSEVGPDLQDLQDTLRAIAGALANYQQSTAKEWHLNRPSADAINALIRAKAEKLSG
jgi:hypothetical protein